MFVWLQLKHQKTIFRMLKCRKKFATWIVKTSSVEKFDILLYHNNVIIDGVCRGRMVQTHVSVHEVRFPKSHVLSARGDVWTLEHVRNRRLIKLLIFRLITI